MTADGTRVMLSYVAKRLNIWLRFGHPRAELILDGWHCVVELPPHALCCRVHWAANMFGTQSWQLAVFQTGAPGEDLVRCEGVMPGATMLLEARRADDVRCVLRLIDDMEGAGIDPAHSAPDYWRVVHQRLCVREAPPAYTLARHQAHLAHERCT